MTGRWIMILGCPGAGKSTLARELGARTGFPVTHLDMLYFRPNWVEHSADFDARAIAAANGDCWVIDGSYSGNPSFDHRLARADTVLMLDFPPVLCMIRVILRAWRGRGRTRLDMAPDCPERVDGAFLRYIWNWRRDIRPRTLRRLAEAGQKPEILRGPRDLSVFLAGLELRRKTTALLDA